MMTNYNTKERMNFMANKHNITFNEISRNASKEAKRATSLSRISEAKEAVATLAKRAKRSISKESFTSMIEHTEVSKQEALINATLDSYHKENIELKRSNKNLKKALKSSKKNLLLAVAISSAISGFAAYNISSMANTANNRSQDFIIENANENAYDFSKLFNRTNSFMESALISELSEKYPDKADDIHSSRFDCFRESSGNSFDVYFVENSYSTSMQSKKYSVEMDDKFMDVYESFSNLRDISSSNSTNKNSVDYYLKVNEYVLDLQDALKGYQNEENKNLEKSAKDVLEESRTTVDEQER